MATPPSATVGVGGIGVGVGVEVAVGVGVGGTGVGVAVFVDAADVNAAFVGFLGRLRAGGVAVVCADDPGAMAVAAGTDRRVVTYGTAASADVRLEVTGPRTGTVRTGDVTATLSLAISRRPSATRNTSTRRALSCMTIG